MENLRRNLECLVILRLHLKKPPYPKNLARRSPCNTCEFGGDERLYNQFYMPPKECKHCIKHNRLVIDCLCKLAEMENKHEEEP